jgi:murein DD-endopeptidase MepM/ murein hydrolase activator NlpD
VDAGQVVAAMGGTGEVTAPHLHFEVWKDGETVNPRVVIPGEPEGPRRD